MEDRRRRRTPRRASFSEVVDGLRRVVVVELDRDRTVVCVERGVGHGAETARPARVRPAEEPRAAPGIWFVMIDRIVHFRPRTIFAVLGILLAVGVCLYVLWVARHVLSWLLIALFLALALNPAVEFLQRHGIKRAGSPRASPSSSRSPWSPASERSSSRHSSTR